MLNYYIEDIEESAYYTQGICQFIEEKMKPELRISLLPELLQLLKLGTDENCVDEYALWALRKIGSPQADAVIPILREKILSQRKEYIRCKAIEALADFDPSVVRPLIPVLQDCLQDDSQKIRDSARKILTWLGEI
jgi:HEAT repeat protein